MCTNSALVDSLECYLEDIVECFEDFVKKSLVIITLGVGALVGMLVYLLKTLNERSNMQEMTTGGQGLSNSDGAQILSEAGRGQWVGTAVGGHKMSEADRDLGNALFKKSSRTRTKNTENVTSKFGETMLSGREEYRSIDFNTNIKNEKNDENDKGIMIERDIRNYRSVQNTKGSQNEKYIYDDKDRETRKIKSSSSKFSLKHISPRNITDGDDEEVLIKDKTAENYEDNRHTISDESLDVSSRAGFKNCQKSSSKCCMHCPKRSLASRNLPTVCIRKTTSSCAASVVSSCDEVTKDCSEDNVCPRKTSHMKKICPRTMSGASCKSRLAIPSLLPCQIPKRHPVSPRPCMKAVSDRQSCCSVCCDDDPQ